MKQNSRKEINWHKIPDPKEYYLKYFPNLKLATEWVKVVCPFHDDKTPSLSINLKHGGYICRGECKTKGNLIKFHMRRHNLGFVEACKSLGVWPYAE